MCIFCGLGAPIKNGVSGIWKHLFAWGLHKLDPVMHRKYGSRKEKLLKGLSGTIVEIGPGSGVNFRFYEEGARVIAVEPNRYLYPYLRQAAGKNGLELTLHEACGEALPLEDSSVDVAVGTLVLCSVSRPADVLKEIRRVLKPEGRFVFLEHVAEWDNARLNRMQKRIRPVWERLFDGCHPDRRTWMDLEKAGFQEVHIDSFHLSIPIVAPHISGYASNQFRAKK